MRCRRRRTLAGSVVMVAFLAICVDAWALIAGRDAEATAAKHEANGDFRNAAVWRLVAARGFRELIIPFEIESVRSYSQAGNTRLAAICAERAEVEYPRKVRRNHLLYAQDIEKAGGEKVREEIERDAAEILAKYAPIPFAVPSRMDRTEEEEKKGNWTVAADYRELRARVLLLVTVPFFEREGDRAADKDDHADLLAASLKYLELARENFAAAAADYRRAAEEAARKTEADSNRIKEFSLRKAAEMTDQAEAASLLIASKRKAQESSETGPSPRDRKQQQ